MTWPPKPSRMRRIPTGWGDIFATCTEPDLLHFSTNLTGTGGESHLVINRVTYRCTFDMRRDEDDGRGHPAHVFAGGWRVSYDAGWYGLGRWRERGEATETARRVFRDEILPTLAAWAEGDQAAGLLAEGETHWRAACCDDGAETRRTLIQAIERVDALLVALDAGERITADDEKFLRKLRLGNG